jgi:hypothetical protein
MGVKGIMRLCDPRAHLIFVMNSMSSFSHLSDDQSADGQKPSIVVEVTVESRQDLLLDTIAVLEALVRTLSAELENGRRNQTELHEQIVQLGGELVALRQLLH